MERDYADTIRKLLDKAESTTFEEERDTFLAKAQHLMTLYGIDAAMIQAARPAEREELVEAEIPFAGIYRANEMSLASAVAAVNDCRVWYTTNTWTKPHRNIMHIAGFKSDVDRVVMLTTSLQVQMATAKAAFRKELPSYFASGDKYRATRTFIDGYITGVRGKLEAAKKAATDEAVAARAEASGKTVEETSTEVGIVLRSRKDQVSDWVDSTHGKFRTVSRRQRSGGYSAFDAGRAAGSRADTGQTRMGAGPKGALGA